MAQNHQPKSKETVNTSLNNDNVAENISRDADYQSNQLQVESKSFLISDGQNKVRQRKQKLQVRKEFS